MASRSVNRCTLLGHVTRNAETAFTPSGASATKFTVATNRSWKDPQTNERKDEVNYTNVVLWRQENVGAFLTKGKQVYVEGRLQTRSYEDREGKKTWTTEVVADEVILLGGKAEGEASAQSTQPAPTRIAPAKRISTPQGRDDAFGRGMELTDEDVAFS